MSKKIIIKTDATNNSYRIGVFGLGFVGLTTALGFAEKGFFVQGYDVNQHKRKLIAQGTVPFLEAGLDEALSKNLGETFFVAESAVKAAEESDIIFFCVGTPCGENGKVDLKYLFSALNSIMSILQDGKFRVLIIKSTVPPGTTEKEVIPYLRNKEFNSENHFAVVNNPEFLREGKCWEDFMNPDRIVCGLNNQNAASILRNLYSVFDAPLHLVSLNTGEYIKYLSNTMLASMISFSNEMSLIADGIGNIDVAKAFHILHEDKRLKNSGIASYIFPGCGYGGYCLPKDTQAMAVQAKAYGVSPHILEEVIALNEKMPSFFVKKVKKLAAEHKNIGILGLSFKPNSDDVRDSVAAKMIELLLQAGYSSIYAYDPHAQKQFDAVYHFNEIIYCSSKEELCKESSVILLVTAWNEFKNLAAVFPDKEWIDCRYFLNSAGESK